MSKPAMSQREIRAVMVQINEMRRTNNPRMISRADRMQDALEAAAEEEAAARKVNDLPSEGAGAS